MRLVPIHAPRAVPPVGAALGAIQRASARALFTVRRAALRGGRPTCRVRPSA